MEAGANPPDEKVSKRVNVTLPDEVYELLELLADKQGRTVANLAAFIIESSIWSSKEKGEIPTLKKRG